MRSLAHVETLNVLGIPILHIVPEDRLWNSLPTIFLYHGWTSCKENYRFAAEILSLYGYRVIIPDAPLHGERQSAKNAQSDFWNVIIQSVEEFQPLLDFVSVTWGVVAEKIAVVGSSMGGFIAAGVFAQHPFVKCLVSINGSGAWEESDRIFRLMEGLPPATEDELRLIRKFDPIRHIKHLPIRPILLQHGDSDSIVPIAVQRRFYDELVKNYGGNQANLLEFQEIPRVNHYISLGMFEHVCDWLCTHLDN